MANTVIHYFYPGAAGILYLKKFTIVIYFHVVSVINRIWRFCGVETR